MTDQTPDPTCAACGHLASGHRARMRGLGHDTGEMRELCRCLLSEADVLRSALRASAAGSEDTRLRRALDLLESLVDPAPCYFDHHGGCQAHSFLDLPAGVKCPNAEAQGLLAARSASPPPAEAP